jgi:hypothetical protein
MPQHVLNNMNIKFVSNVFKILSDLQFKFWINRINSIKCTKYNRYSKHFKNCAKLENVGPEIIGAQYKKVGGKKQIHFVECQENTLDISILCWVSKHDIQQRHTFVECLVRTLGIVNSR